MSSGQKPPASKPGPPPDKKPEPRLPVQSAPGPPPDKAPAPTPPPDKAPAEPKTNLQSTLADSLGLTVTQKPVAQKPAAPKAPAPPRPKVTTGLFVQDAAAAVIAPPATNVRGSEPELPKASPRITPIEGAGLRAKQGIETPRLPISFKMRDGWADVAGRNIGRESGFRNNRMALHEMEASYVKALAEYNKKRSDGQS